MRVFLNHWVRPGRSLPLFGLLSLPLLLGLATGAQAQVECTTANADGSYTVPNNWALKPSGLARGTTFRLLFMTSTQRNAASTDIDDYNTFVQDRAKAGHSAITDSCGNLFKVVGATASVNARANTDSESADTDAAIYWLTGAKVADNYTDFYDNSWDSRARRDESGGNISSNLSPWTGTNTDGTAHSNPLGFSSTRFGSLATSTTSPLSQGNGVSTNNGRFYALSPIFKALPTITITGGSAVTEGSNATFTVARMGGTTAALTVLLRVSENENNGRDFVASSNEGDDTVTIPIGSSSVNYTVATVGDSTHEPPGEVRLFLRANNSVYTRSNSSATVTVNDDDEPSSPTTPSVSFASASMSVAENVNVGSFQVQVNLSPPPTSNFNLAYSTEGTATLGENPLTDDAFTANTSPIEVEAGSSNVKIEFLVWNDNSNESDETIVLTLSSGSGYTVGSPSVHTATITDDDGGGSPTLPTVTITGGSAVTEGSPATFTVSRTGATTSALTVLLAVSENEVATRDFVTSGNEGNKQVVIQAGSASATYTVATVSDSTDEPNGAVTVALRNSAAYTNGSSASATVTVNDDDGQSDALPTVTITGGSPVTEGTGAEFTVTRTGATTGALTVLLEVTENPEDGRDFVASSDEGDKQVIIPIGSTTATYTVATVNDQTDEPNGEVTVALRSNSAYSVGSSSSATVTVNDTSSGSEDGSTSGSKGLTFSLSGLTVAEGGSDVYTVRLSSEPTGPVTVTITSDNGDVSISPAALTFNASGSNLWSVAQSVTVSAVQDPDTSDDSATLRHTASGGGYGSVSGMVNVSVIDSDTPPVVSIMGSGPISEGDDAHFTLRATPPPEEGDSISVSVSISSSGDVVAAGESGSRSVTIAASGAASFTVSTQEDDVYEEDGRITATVAAGSGYRPHGSNASAVVVVEDDDPGLELSLPGAASSLSVSEGRSTSYTMALATEPTGDVTVTVSISGGEGSGLTITPTRLVFTPSNWDKQQRVTVTAAENAAATGRTITLSHRASGGGYDGVALSDVMVRVVSANPAEAVGGWQLRFGRTVSQQVVDALRQRWSTNPTAGHLTVAGETISSTTPPLPLAENEGVLSKALGFDPLTSEAVLEGSSFNFTPEAEGGAPQLAVWGQGALSSFKGEGNSLSSLRGDVTTLLLGADWRTARWQAGAALSHSWGTGSYAADAGADGDLSSSLTGLFPYGRYGLTPRLAIWAVAGYGWGHLSLQPDGVDGDYKPTTTMGMAALGMDGLLLDGGKEGISLSATADLLTLKTTSTEVEGLDSSEGSVSRLRLGLEATRAFPLANGASLLPTMAVGIRQDSGNAETGFGMDVGAGMVWRDPGRGIRGEVRGRTLLTHREESFQEQGMAISFSWDPTPSKRGPSLSLSHAVGATASGGMDALLNPTTMEDASPSRGQEFAAELAYGFPAHRDRLTLTPAVALALSSTSRNYSLLWSLAPYAEQMQTPPWEVALEGERLEQHSPTAAVHHSLKLTFSSLF